MAEQLLNCPFCGDKFVHAEIVRNGLWGVHCPNGQCPTAGNFIVTDFSEAEAVAAWNTRADFLGDIDASRDFAQTISASLDFVRQVARLSHSGDEDYTYADDLDDANCALDGLIAKARDINTLPLRLVLGEALSRAPQVERDSSREDPCSDLPQQTGGGWRDIASAPKDGTPILAWTVHANAKFSKDPIAEGWACVSLIRWIDFNGGGWTWEGLCGEHVAWQPLPAPPPPGGDKP